MVEKFLTLHLRQYLPHLVNVTPILPLIKLYQYVLETPIFDGPMLYQSQQCKVKVWFFPFHFLFVVTFLPFRNINLGWLIRIVFYKKSRVFDTIHEQKGETVLIRFSFLTIIILNLLQEIAFITHTVHCKGLKLIQIL